MPPFPPSLDVHPFCLVSAGHATAPTCIHRIHIRACNPLLRPTPNVMTLHIAHRTRTHLLNVTSIRIPVLDAGPRTHARTHTQHQHQQHYGTITHTKIMISPTALRYIPALIPTPIPLHIRMHPHTSPTTTCVYCTPLD
ncbi:hypothetical protein D9615_003828 [Tricholomella constricta]|uniref:Uncharacterized protein n=1 Tax=Tricholomella constricta TaxID=117010 RepID=A0A8H5HHX1_9AGAR|nr:hypothetical protein D9615_003828 [Tricholomella constricta]